MNRDCFWPRLGKDAILRFNKPNGRCPQVTVDPTTTVEHPQSEPLATLRRLRLIDPTTSEEEAARRKALGQSPLFAVNYSLAEGGWVEVGDEVYVEEV